MGDPVFDPVLVVDGDAPWERIPVGVGVTLELVDVPGEAVLVPLPEAPGGVGVVGVAEAEVVGVMVLLAVGVLEGVTPTLRGEIELEIHTVPLEVKVPVGLGVGVQLLVPLVVVDGDTLAVRLEVGVIEGEAPLVREGVCDSLTVGVPERVGVGLAVGEGVGEDDTAAAPDPDTLGLRVMEGVPLGEAPMVKLAVGVGVTVLLPLTVLVGVMDAEPVCPVGEELPVGEGVDKD